MACEIEVSDDGTVQIGDPGAAELFSFVHLADSHLRVPHPELPWTRELADRMSEVVEKANALEPDFVVFTGDTLDSFTPDNIAYLKEVFARFHAPVHFALGNHDPGIRSIDMLRKLVADPEDFAAERERIREIRKNNTDVPSEANLQDHENGMLQSSPKIRENAIRYWEQEFGLATINYSFDLKGFHLVFFNFDREGLADGELEWLEADIRRSREHPTMLFFHVPLPIPALVPEVLARFKRNICLVAGPNTDRFFSLLSKNPQILAIFGAHIHFDSVHRYKDTVQITTAPVSEGRFRRVVVRGSDRC